MVILSPLTPKQRPIALINNLAKFPAKCLASRLTPVAHRTLFLTQSAFVKGRFILDGVLRLHEIIHDIVINKNEGLFLSLTMRRIMIELVKSS